MFLGFFFVSFKSRRSLNFFLYMYLIYNVVLVSAVKQIESVIHMHISTLLSLFSHIGHYRVLSRVSGKFFS